MCEKAATVGHVTEHAATPLTGGPGAANVLINGKNAWRAEVDQHGCPEHAPEMVYAGAERVFINNKRAVRESDFLESNGAGAPNRINDGSVNVYIGTTRLGMASDAAMREYCAAICALKRDWDKLTPDERRAAYEAAVKAQFDRMGVPAPTLELFPARPGVGAWWSQGEWKIGLPDDTFTGGFNNWTMKQATYHELRHAEQTVTALRERAGRVPTPGRESRADDPWWEFWRNDTGANSDPVDAGDLVDMTGVPYDVAQAAVDNPYPPDSPEARYGRVNAEQHLTDAGKQRSSDVNGAIWGASDRAIKARNDGDKAAEDQANKDGAQARQDYDHLPGGSDAGATADAFAASCPC